MSLAELNAAVWGLSALRVAAESDLLTALASGEADIAKLATAAQLTPEITTAILDVLEAHGFLVRNGESRRLSDEGAGLAKRLDWFRADLAATFGNTRALVLDARASDLGSGWRHTDAELLRAQGTLSLMMTESVVRQLVEALPDSGLDRPGAVILDVGSGAGGGLIGFCKRLPELRAVGLEPLKGARLEARAAIAAAGLEARVEVRPIRMEALSDRQVYRVAHVPAAFILDDALLAGLARVREALVPGGYLLLSGWRANGDPRVAAASRLRYQCWGAGPRSASTLATMVRNAGFVDIREAPAAGDVVPLIARAPR